MEAPEKGEGLQGKCHSFVAIDVLSEQPEGFYKEWREIAGVLITFFFL